MRVTSEVFQFFLHGLQTVGNGGLRHAHPGGIVVDAHVLKVDGLDHFLLVGVELLDGGVETLFISGAGKEASRPESSTA